MRNYQIWVLFGNLCIDFTLSLLYCESESRVWLFWGEFCGWALLGNNGIGRFRIRLLFWSVGLCAFYMGLLFRIRDLGIHAKIVKDLIDVTPIDQHADSAFTLFLNSFLAQFFSSTRSFCNFLRFWLWSVLHVWGFWVNSVGMDVCFWYFCAFHKFVEF